jgi:predicted SnoaL-like aldol condensation-catalyzing enzyme
MDHQNGAVQDANSKKEEKQKMSQSSEEKNKTFVLKAFDTLFNKRDYAAAERYWSPKYIQHSAHIAPGREGLFGLVKNAPAELKYENQLILTNGDYVMLHGRFSGRGPGTPNWIAADIVRMENGLLAEHWDVLQDEATRAASKSGLPMFGEHFGEV